MPGRKRPTSEDAATARRIVLDGLAGDGDLFEFMTELAPLHPRYNTFPGDVSWWQTDDFWEYALFAAVAYIRAAVDRANVPVREACQQLAEYPVHPVP